MPIITIFFKENGLSMRDIFVLQAFFSVAVIFLEIPSGYFSDKVGRKKTLIVGYSLAILGYAIYSFSYGFWGFLWAEIILGFGCSFISGTDSALLYDTLLETKQKSRYTELEGRRYSLAMISESLASVMGGFMAVLSLRLPFYIDTAVLVLFFPVVFSLVEPKSHVVLEEKNAWETMSYVFKKIFVKGSEIKWVIIYSSIVASSTLTMVWMIQPYLEEVAIPLELFGVIWAMLMLISAFFSWYAGKIEKHFGTKKVLSSLVFLVAIGYFAIYLSWVAWGVVFLLFFYVVRGLHNPVVSAYVNGKVSSDIRATILSAKNLFGRVIFSVVGPFMGWIADVISLGAAMLYAGIIFTITGVVALAFLRKNNSF
jgi:MFS family permease